MPRIEVKTEWWEHELKEFQKFLEKKIEEKGTKRILKKWILKA